MELKDLLQQARNIWGDDTMSPEEIAVALGVVYGDICRAVRDSPSDQTELKKELGNVVFSTVRWIDDLGFDVEECIELSRRAQLKYVNEKGGV